MTGMTPDGCCWICHGDLGELGNDPDWDDTCKPCGKALTKMERDEHVMETRLKLLKEHHEKVNLQVKEEFEEIIEKNTVLYSHYDEGPDGPIWTAVFYADDEEDLQAGSEAVLFARQFTAGFDMDASECVILSIEDLKNVLNAHEKVQEEHQAKPSVFDKPEDWDGSHPLT